MWLEWGAGLGVPQDVLVVNLNNFFGRYFGISKQQERADTRCKKLECVMFGATFKTKSNVDSLPRSGFIFRNTEITG